MNKYTFGRAKRLFRFFAYILLPLAGGGWVGVSCSDWDDHYDEVAVATDAIDIYGGDIVSYLRSTQSLSQISGLFEQAGVYATTTTDKQYTFVVCDDDVFSAGSATIADRTQFANYCVADVAILPSELVDGFGINNRAGKTIWVYGEGDDVHIDNYSITKVVKTQNGYVYHIGGVLPVRQSVYEYLQSLGDDYSMFKELVAGYEQRVFDREHSEAIGVNNAGQTVYDTIWVTRNTLMDRYTDTGVDYWNMREENYTTTMFIPSNQQIEDALRSALDSIPVWLNREATDADRKKFEEWIVRACFYNQRLEEDRVAPEAADIDGVDGYCMEVDELADETTYTEASVAHWRPGVMKLDAANQVSLSNGLAYYCTSFKIPNHVVIYRVKTRLFQIWEARNMRSEEVRNQYFTWTNLDNIQNTITTLTSYDALLAYGWPIVDYNLLSGTPTPEAVADSLTVGVEYMGLVYDDATNEALECRLPAGEYYLRMGFDRTVQYSIDIYFNDSIVASSMAANLLNADRMASDIPYSGLFSVGYPEGYDPLVWIAFDANANAYDTDGYPVALVTLKQNGTFKIRVESHNLAAKYKGADKEKLLMYHWCLRPTQNNY